MKFTVPLPLTHASRRGYEPHLHSITTTRQRRELREREVVEFTYTLRKRTPFIVRAILVDESVVMHIH